MKNKKFDLVIVGGGPSGIWAAYYAAHRGLSVALIEENHALGGLPMFNYPNKPILDIPAVIDVSGKTLVEKLLLQMSKHKESISVFLETNIVNIKKKDGSFYLNLLSKNKSNVTIEGAVVLLSQGNGSMHPVKLDINKEVDSVYYSINELSSFYNKDILISGGGDSALEYALILAKQSPKNTIYICHRREEFRATTSLVEKISRMKNIKTLLPCVVSDIHSKKKLEVEVKDRNTNNIEKVKVDKVLVQHGFKIERSNIAFDVSIKLEKESSSLNSKYKTSSNFESSEKKIYVVGFSSSTVSHNLILTCLGSVTISICHMIEQYFDNKTRKY